MPVSMTTLVAMPLALALAAGLSAAAARLARRAGPDAAGPWWGSLAVGLAYAIGHVAVAIPAWPPWDITDRIPFIALAGAAMAAILTRVRGRSWAGMAGFLVLSADAYVVILGPVLGAEEIPRETITWLLGTAVVTLLATMNIALLDAPGRRSELWSALTVFAAGAAVALLVLGDSAVLFQLGGVISMVLAVSLLASWGRPVGGGIMVASSVLTALVIEGFVYAFLPSSSATLLAGSPAMLWLTRVGPVARLGPKGRAAVASGLILIPVAVAVGLGLASAPADDSGY